MIYLRGHWGLLNILNYPSNRKNVIRFEYILLEVSFYDWETRKCSVMLFFVHSNIFSKHRPSGPILSISQNVLMCVCTSHFLTLFNGPFAPTSRSQMSKLLEFSESWGKNNEKKWCQNRKLLLLKGVKLVRQKKVFFYVFSSSVVLSVKTSFCPHFTKCNVQTF